MSYSRNQRLVPFVIGLLYITTMLHWSAPYKKGWIRAIDITMVWSTFLTVGRYIYYNVDPAYHIHCIIHFFIVMCAHFVNETLYYYQITEKVYLPEIKKEDQIVKYHPFHYFSLRYTYPNTIERENAYKRSIFTHCAFVHIWMSLSISYYVYYHSLPTTGITNAKEIV
jgi:hypothetical protein